MTDADKKEWIIQKCNNAFKDDYEDWPPYDTPMTREEAANALKACAGKWPGFDFRAHRIARILKMEPRKS